MSTDNNRGIGLPGQSADDIRQLGTLDFLLDQEVFVAAGLFKQCLEFRSARPIAMRKLLELGLEDARLDGCELDFLAEGRGS